MRWIRRDHAGPPRACGADPARTDSPRLRRALSLLPVIVLLSACGSAPPAPVPATHDDFRAIQRHEAEIAHARPLATDPERACEDACGGAADACDAAEAICRIAADTSDLDAIDRCESARGACRDLRATAGARCTCGHG